MKEHFIGIFVRSTCGKKIRKNKRTGLDLFQDGARHLSARAKLPSTLSLQMHGFKRLHFLQGQYSVLNYSSIFDLIFCFCFSLTSRYVIIGNHHAQPYRGQVIVNRWQQGSQCVQDSAQRLGRKRLQQIPDVMHHCSTERKTKPAKMKYIQNIKFCF